MRRDGCRLPLLAPHGCHEAVTAAGVVGDIPLSRAGITERLAERGDMDPQRSLVHDSPPGGRQKRRKGTKSRSKPLKENPRSQELRHSVARARFTGKIGMAF